MAVEFDINIEEGGYYQKQRLIVRGKDIHIFYLEYKKIFNIETKLDYFECDKNPHSPQDTSKIGYIFSRNDHQQILEIISRIRHPEWYNLQMVQKNTEELEKLQYQICPGKYFLQVMQEEFPKISPFDITKMILQK